MNETVPSSEEKSGCLKKGCLVTLVLLLVMALTAAFTAWWVKRQFKPYDIAAVELTKQEQKVLESKAKEVEKQQKVNVPEEGEKSIWISEREINGLISRYTQLGDVFQVDLGRNSLVGRMKCAGAVA